MADLTVAVDGANVPVYLASAPDAVLDAASLAALAGKVSITDLSSTAPDKGAALVGVKHGGTGALARTVHDKLENIILLTDYATGDGPTDDTTAVGNAFAEAVSSGNILDGAGKTYRLTAKVNIASGLKLRNATFLIDHSGTGFGQATAGGGGNEIGRCHFDNVKVLAAQDAAIAWDGVTFQYCTWTNCAVMNGGGKFVRAWKLSNVAYWNTFIACEVEQVSSYGWDLDDANDTRFYQPRHVDFTGTPTAALYMSGACSGVSVFGPSFEAQWAQHPIQFHASATNNTVYGGRCENHGGGGAATAAVKFNGSAQNAVVDLYVVGLSASDTVGNNRAIISTGTAAAVHMGSGQSFWSQNTVGADTAGGALYNTATGRFTGYDAAGAFKFAATVARETHDMNGNAITNIRYNGWVTSLADPGSPAAGQVVAFIDSADGHLYLRNSGGTKRMIQRVGAIQTVSGSRGGNAALASLLTALAAEGIIVDGSSA